ncbi:MAG: NAD(P)/FAD-dependent oxidoreductase [Planctomycetota bacterium]|jgi:predicted NAD/FAD-dependent oxidoreductase
MRAVVVGGGLAGVTCARSLQDAGLDVVVLDKARGAGGRASTRRVGEVAFDHGASAFSVRGPVFGSAVRAWREAGIVRSWRGETSRLESEATPEGQFVGVPGMSAIVRHASQGLSVRYSTQAVGLERRGDKWWVDTKEGAGFGPFDCAFLAVPAPQAVPLLRAVPSLATRVAQVCMDPCWSLLVHFARRPPREWTGTFISNRVFQWISGEHTKPKRASDGAWVAQATPDWSREHLEDHPDAVRGLLLAHLGVVAGPLPPIRHASAHRWRYARARAPLNEPFLLDEALRLGVCGDWCLGDRLEDAYVSGLALGQGAAKLYRRRNAS